MDNGVLWFDLIETVIFDVEVNRALSGMVDAVRDRFSDGDDNNGKDET